MADDLQFGFNLGLVTARGRETLKLGELQTATGIYYKPGDPHGAEKLRGRSQFDDITAGIVKGLALCQFDAGGSADRLVAFHGTDYFGAPNPGATGTFASLVGSLNASATRLSAAHFDDKWYLVNGYDRVKVLMSSGTIRNASMYPPTTKPTVSVASTSITRNRPQAPDVNSGWVNPELARDTIGASDPASLSTYAHATASATAAAKTCTWANWASNTDANRVLRISTRLEGGTANPFGAIAGIAGVPSGGYSVTLKVEVLGDTGGTRILYNETRTAPHAEPYFLIQTPVTANSNAISVRATFTYNTGTVQATYRIYDIRIVSGGEQSAFTPDNSFFYAITEFDQANNLESAPGEYIEIKPADFIMKNVLTLTFSTAPVNSTTTHYKIYRTFDGGTTPQDLGYRDILPILDTNGAQLSSATWQDDFSEGFTVDDELSPIIDLLRIPDRSTEDGELFYKRNIAVPTLSYVTAWKGSLCGLSREFPRALRYSVGGAPEYWPEIYVIEKFPLPEHDELVAILPCADTLIILAEGAVLTLTDLPQVLDGVFNAGEASPLRAAPGCVGPYAATAYSVAGEPRVAWVSRFGIYSSNGQTVWRLSDDLNWATTVSVANLSSAALHWDSEKQVIVFALDSDGGGTNDRFYLLHMGPEHQKESGPKITGPHFGSINCMASGVDTSGTYRLYSGHVSDGNVYLEGGATTDASSSYSGSQVPLIVKTGRRYGQWRDWMAYKGNLRHTDFGVGQTCSILWSWGRDSGQTGSVTKSAVSLASQKGTEFFIGRSGEWAEMQITHTGDGTGSLLDTRVAVQVMDKSGRKVG